eukprot:IDg20441t1
MPPSTFMASLKRVRSFRQQRISHHHELRCEFPEKGCPLTHFSDKDISYLQSGREERFARKCRLAEDLVLSNRQTYLLCVHLPERRVEILVLIFGW